MIVAGADQVELWGRRTERQMLDALLTDARAGHSQVLVVRGEPGIGKTALLSYLHDQAPDCHVASVAGVQAERELPYACLQRLCGPFLHRIEELPSPQATALAVALGSSAGVTPDRFLVGLAALTLLSHVADERPLVCVIDDAQWMDQASAEVMGFVARRLAAEPLAMVFAVRETGEDAEDDDPLAAAATGADALAGLPDLWLEGLADVDAQALLDASTAGPLEATVRGRLIAETRGNPLALLELSRDVAQAELSYGGSSRPRVGERRLSLTPRLEAGFRHRVAQLPPETGFLLLVAAAEPTGDVGLLWRAAAELDVPTHAAAPAQQAGLLVLGTQVVFRHPLVRSTVYNAATPADRRRAHAALASATDPISDPDRRAWHRAHATAGLDESVAGELVASAARAKARGGLAASAAFLSRASELTADPHRRAQRALEAAEEKLAAGAPEAALVLVAIAESGPLSELERARGELLRAQVSFALTRGRDAASLLLAAAKRLESIDATLAHETYLDAFAAALFAGRYAGDASVEDVAHAVLQSQAGPAARPLPVACDKLLKGLAVLLTSGHTAGTPLVQQALDAFRLEPMRDEDALRWLWLASRVARAIGDDRAWDIFTERHVRLARAHGALTVLPLALTERFSAQLFAGHMTAAISLLAEADAVLQITGGELGPHIRFLLAAWQGREADALALIEANRIDVARRGEGLFVIGTDWTSAVFYNGAGRYPDALVSAERAAQHPYELGLSTWVYPELVEAAVRSGQPERAGDAMTKLTEIADAAGTDWVLGVAARSRALLAEGKHADELYREAIERLSRTGVLVTLARAHLLYGEWLRRERRRTDARAQLRTAHEMFLDIGMAGYAERARRELTATGETARARSVDTLNDLTTQEAQIARLAVSGRTNPEIAAELFLSPRTIEWHLRKVFGKLGVHNRKELRGVLPAARAGV